MTLMEGTALGRLSKAALALAVSVLTVGGQATWAAADNPRSIAGVWRIIPYQPQIRPVDGAAIPFTPAGRAAYDKNVAGLKDGSVQDFALTLCLPPGVTRVMGASDPFEIVQAQNTVAFLAKGIFRLVPLDAEHSKDIELFPGFMGDSIAHWEGDTLLIDTLGVNQHTWLDASGVPHGYDLHTVERIRKIDAGRHLENVITIEDKEFFTRPWQARYVYEPHAYVSMATGDQPCDERHRASSHVVAPGAPR
jgi:hypothetical protein